MKLKIVNEGNGVSTNVVTTNFNIEMNGKAFKALFSDIYTEKINAVVREVGSNCADAHKMAGKVDTPFKIEIHKDEFNGSYIKFIDYGVGMSKSQIENLYTSFFSSNKDTNNDCIGGFGIGSKSPLAYTDKFITESVKDGFKNIALIVSVDGQPQYNLIVEDSPTDEPNGTIVRIDIDSKDVNDFIYQSNWQFRTFKPFPIIEHNTDYKINDIDTFLNPFYEDDNVILLKQGYSNNRKNIYVSIDGITYDYDIGSCVSVMSNLFHAVLKINTGDVEVSLSRESIVRNDKTTKFLCDKVKQYSAQIEDRLSKDLFDVIGIKRIFNILDLFSDKFKWSSVNYYDNLLNKVYDLVSVNIDKTTFKDLVYYSNTNETVSKTFTPQNSTEWYKYKKNLNLTIPTTIINATTFDDKDKTVILFKIKTGLKNIAASVSNFHGKIKRLNLNANVIYFEDYGTGEDYNIIKNYLIKNNIKYQETCYNNYRADLGIIKQTTNKNKRIPLTQLDVHCIGVNGLHCIGDKLPDSRYIDLSTFGKDDICVIAEKDNYDAKYLNDNIIALYELFKSVKPSSKFFFGAFTSSKYDIARTCGYEDNLILNTTYKMSIVKLHDVILPLLDDAKINTIKHLTIEKFLKNDIYYWRNPNMANQFYSEYFSYNLIINSNSTIYYKFIKDTLIEINEKCKTNLDDDMLNNSGIHTKESFIDFGITVIGKELGKIISEKIPLVKNIDKLVNDYIENKEV